MKMKQVNGRKIDVMERNATKFNNATLAFNLLCYYHAFNFIPEEI